MTIISVKDLNKKIKSFVESQADLKNIKVKGEITGFKTSGNHAYFRLKDDIYTLNCVFWGFTKLKLNFIVKDGIKVVCKGNITTYYQNGGSVYQLKCCEIEEQGEGKCRREFEELKAKLSSEGLFDTCKKRKIPKYCRRIGLVTAKGSHAYGDLCKVGKNRYTGVQFILSSCKTQGKDAHLSIIEALKKLEKYNDIDVIVLARGGGSFEDLHCFNNEDLARYIVKMKTPIITGIGHEPDITIADLVADKRASTPTDAINTAVISKKELARELDTLYSGVILNYINFINNLKLNNESTMNLIKIKNLLYDINDKKYKNYNELKAIYAILDSKIKSKINSFEKVKKSIEKPNLLYKINKNKLDIDNKITFVNKKLINILNEQKIKLEELQIESLQPKLCRKLNNLHIEKENILLFIKNSMNNSINYKNKDLNLVNDINNLYMVKINKYNNDLSKIDLGTKVLCLYKNIEDKRLICKQVNKNISDMIKNILVSRNNQLNNLVEYVYSLGPGRTLTRGYSIITNNDGSIINTSKDLIDGELYNIKFSDDEVKVHIKLLKKEN